MRKLFIVDPALSSCQGHHFSVTNMFSRFAENEGLDVIWLVNKKFVAQERNAGRSFRTHSAFSQGTYDAYTKPALIVNYINETKQTFTAKILRKLKSYARKLPQKQFEILKFFVTSCSDLLGRIGEFRLKQKDVDVQVVADVAVTSSPSAAQELVDALSKYQTSPADIILFHTSDAHTYLDIVELFYSILPIAKWNSLPVIHLSTPYDDCVMPHNKTSVQCHHSVRHLDAIGVLGNRVHLHAENEMLADYLTDFFSEHVSPLYIPARPFETRNIPNKKVVFSYLGAARTEKGFSKIAESVMLFLERFCGDHVEFIIQISPQIMGYSPDVKESVAQLRRVEDSRLLLIDTVQTPQSYEATLSSSDVLLLCYDQSRYRVRSSGIVMEGLANAKVMIVTDDTFMSYIAGDAGVAVTDVESIVQSIRLVLDNFFDYQERAANRAELYLTEISTQSFSRLLRNDQYNADANILMKKQSFNDGSEEHNLSSARLI